MDDKAPQTYETSLEAVGSYLDAQGATEFKLIETPEGFLVRYERKGRSEGVMVMFRFGDLRRTALDIDVFHKVRHPLDDRQYRKLLRAIGHDLDSSNAVSILLDELPESMLITYEFDDPGRGYVLRKRMALAGPRDRERLLHDVTARGLRLRPRTTAHWQPITDVGTILATHRGLQSSAS